MGLYDQFSGHHPLGGCGLHAHWLLLCRRVAPGGLLAQLRGRGALPLRAGVSSFVSSFFYPNTVARYSPPPTTS